MSKNSCVSCVTIVLLISRSPLLKIIVINHNHSKYIHRHMSGLIPMKKGAANLRFKILTT
jgi:hypothetical protein